jgi:hypothetical protein
VNMMRETDIVEFLNSNIEPITSPSYGISYRASVYLVDGTYLPCVVFRSSKVNVELAIRRFDEVQSGESIIRTGYYDIVKTFTVRGNCVNPYDIGSVEKSRYAFPNSVLSQIRGETRMGWTAFVARMKDGNCFNFGTSFSFEFFEIPKNYTVQDIIEIINHSYVLKTGEIRSYHAECDKAKKADYDTVYRERPFFECYLDGL